MHLKKNYILLFLYAALSLFICFSDIFAATLLPELKKSINYQCKNDDSYKSIKKCRSEILSKLSLQGTDFIYRVQDKDIRKDMILQCNFDRKDAIKFNSCLFEQVAIFFEEDINIPPPVIIETEKNSDDELISVITEPDKNEISLIERLVKSTFFIEAIEKLDSYEAYTGSAVKINSSDLLTACHVVYDYEKKKFIEHIFISNVDHKDDHKRYKAKVIKHNIKKDACVLSSDELSFILVPAMIYIIKMPTKLVPGTSLFVTIFVSVIVTFLHSFNYGSIDLMLVFMLVVGSIIGVQVGQKLGEKVNSSGLRALLAILLLVVGIAIAYDSFFAPQAEQNISKVLDADLNFFSLFIQQFSKEMPFFYGLFSIMFAIFLGVAAAFIRRFISNFKKKMQVKS